MPAELADALSRPRPLRRRRGAGPTPGSGPDAGPDTGPESRSDTGPDTRSDTGAAAGPDRGQPATGDKTAVAPPGRPARAVPHPPRGRGDAEIGRPAPPPQPPARAPGQGLGRGLGRGHDQGRGQGLGGGEAAKPGPEAIAPPSVTAYRTLPTAPRARLRARHLWVLASFLLLVALPAGLTAAYLWTRAADRFVSYTGFSVRSEDMPSALEMLGGVAGIGQGGAASDTEILYRFAESPELVARVDAQLDLRRLWSGPGVDWSDPGSDPVFAYAAPGTIEDLTDYWRDRVDVTADSTASVIEIAVEAFTPEDAQAIATAILEESRAMIHRLSELARTDATRQARRELERAEAQLTSARVALTAFRNRTRIVDPAAAMQSQMGLLSSLQEQLAQAVIELDLTRATAADSTFRIANAARRVEVIEARLEAERATLGLGAAASRAGTEPDIAPMADMVGDYERLAIELGFAEQSYTAARAGLEAALAEAQRQSRYLAAHVRPTLPEAPIRPDRPLFLGLVILFATLGWALLVLSAYALRDRR